MRFTVFPHSHFIFNVIDGNWIQSQMNCIQWILFTQHRNASSKYHWIADLIKTTRIAFHHQLYWISDRPILSKGFNLCIISGIPVWQRNWIRSGGQSTYRGKGYEKQIAWRKIFVQRSPWIRKANNPCAFKVIASPFLNCSLHIRGMPYQFKFSMPYESQSSIE